MLEGLKGEGGGGGCPAGARWEQKRQGWKGGGGCFIGSVKEGKNNMKKSSNQTSKKPRSPPTVTAQLSTTPSWPEWVAGDP